MNTNKIDLIKAEVKKLKSNLIHGACSSQVAMETRCKEEAYNEVLAILDTMQEEPVSKQKLSNVQRTGKNLKEPVSENLEEEIEKYFDAIYSGWTDSQREKDSLVEELCRKIAIDFANWQKKQDQSTIELAEDHAMLAGMEKMKEEMMENIVLETKVMKDDDGDGIDTPYEEWLTLEDSEIPFIPYNMGFKEGDKVKVIVIKED